MSMERTDERESERSAWPETKVHRKRITKGNESMSHIFNCHCLAHIQSQLAKQNVYFALAKLQNNILHNYVWLYAYVMNGVKK